MSLIVFRFSSVYPPGFWDSGGSSAGFVCSSLLPLSFIYFGFVVNSLVGLFGTSIGVLSVVFLSLLLELIFLCVCSGMSSLVSGRLSFGSSVMKSVLVRSDRSMGSVVFSSIVSCPVLTDSFLFLSFLS